MKKFTEKQTRAYYNDDDTLYRSFWDKDGNCHWGYFPTDDTPFAEAMVILNEKMLKLSGIDKHSSILDLGCGNGNNSLFINKKTKTKVTGIDLSDIRIENAKATLKKSKPEVKNKVNFYQSSATNLKFKNKSFSHVWSQATIYHTHNKKKVLQEVYRVLKPGGVFILDDLIKPNKRVSKEANRFVYERLLFNTDFNLLLYQEELVKLGFRIMYAEDMSYHYGLSYLKLADILEQKIKQGKNKQFHDRYRFWINAYRKTWGLMKKGDIGWAMIMCIKT